MFSSTHLIWLAISIVLILVSLFLIIKFKPSYNLVLGIMCVIAVISEVVKLFNHLIPSSNLTDKGSFIWIEDLPFHLCSIQIFTIFIVRFIKNEKVKNYLLGFMFPTCLFGAILALLIPTCGSAFTNVQVYQYFIYHSALIVLGIYIIMKFHKEFSLKNYVGTLVGIGCLTMFDLYINGLTQSTNFLFLSRPPMDNLPLLNLDNGWFVYFLILAVIAITIITLCYLPYIIRAIKHKKNRV